MTSSKTLVWRPDTKPQDSPTPQQKDSARVRPSPKRRDKRRQFKPRKRRSHRPLSPELLAQIRAEGYGRSYVQKQIRKKTPMAFALYGEDVDGLITRRLTYALDVLVNGKVRRIEKINIKYMYKNDQASQLAPFIEIDPELKAQNLTSIVQRSERYHIDDSVLSHCYKEKIPVSLTLRGGEIFTGMIDWFSQYEIKVNLTPGKGLVVFRHGLYHFTMA